MKPEEGSCSEAFFVDFECARVFARGNIVIQAFLRDMNATTYPRDWVDGLRRAILA